MRAWWRSVVVAGVGIIAAWFVLGATAWLYSVALASGEAPLSAFIMTTLLALSLVYFAGGAVLSTYRLLRRQERILAARKACREGLLERYEPDL